MKTLTMIEWTDTPDILKNAAIDYHGVYFPNLYYTKTFVNGKVVIERKVNRSYWIRNDRLSRAHRKIVWYLNRMRLFL